MLTSPAEADALELSFEDLEMKIVSISDVPKSSGAFRGPIIYIFASLSDPFLTYIGMSNGPELRLKGQFRLRRLFSAVLVFSLDASINLTTHKEIEARLLRGAFKRWFWVRWINRRGLWTLGQDQYDAKAHPAMSMLVARILTEAEYYYDTQIKCHRPAVKFLEVTHVMADADGTLFAFGFTYGKNGSKFIILAGSRMSPNCRKKDDLLENGKYPGCRAGLWEWGFLDRVGSLKGGYSSVFFTRDTVCPNERIAAETICGYLGPQYRWRKTTAEEKMAYKLVNNTYRPFEIQNSVNVEHSMSGQLKR